MSKRKLIEKFDSMGALLDFIRKNKMVLSHESGDAERAEIYFEGGGMVVASFSGSWVSSSGTGWPGTFEAKYYE